MTNTAATEPLRPTRAALAFGSPRKLPKAVELAGRVVVLDIAFAYDTPGSGSSGFDKITGRLIKGLGTRLAAWVDHHDHARHAEFSADPRFVLTTKAQHPACPELVTPELVARVGKVDTIVCHTDFDGLCSAAKWLRGGVEPYAGADADARAIDARVGTPSDVADRIDRAIRGRPYDEGLFGVIVRHLATGLADPGLWSPIDAAAAEFVRQEQESRRLSTGYARLRGAPHGVAFVEVPTRGDGLGPVAPYDKTLLLLLGQEREPIAMVVDRDTISLAAAFDSGINFLALLELSGGMPTRVSVPRARLADVFARLGVREPPTSMT
jgi:hypothetical protein